MTAWEHLLAEAAASHYVRLAADGEHWHCICGAEGEADRG